MNTANTTATRCLGATRGGDLCTLSATHGDYCHHHCNQGDGLLCPVYSQTCPMAYNAGTPIPQPVAPQYQPNADTLLADLVDSVNADWMAGIGTNPNWATNMIASIANSMNQPHNAIHGTN